MATQVKKLKQSKHSFLRGV